jgi:TolB-like protein
METCSGEAVRTQLEKILASEGFARNDRLSGFLRFIIEQELSGRGDQLKESIIGVEVFGREPGYDPRQDSVVRTEAAKLRARLAKYYEAAAAPLIIELPKGAYKPVFRYPPSQPVPKQAGPWHRPQLVRPRTLWLAAIVGFLGVAFATLAWWRLHRDEPIPMAVLPLINLSQNPSNDYFTDGLTDEIIRNLSIIDGLAVRSQTSSFVFKGKPQNVRDAGRQLDVEYILEGSVLRAGQQLRINAQLVRVRDDFPLWSGKYDREATDIFAIQDEISRGIVNSLRLKLGRGRRRYETSPEAYDLYLRARSIDMVSRSDEQMASFERAIAKDPSFAPAYSGLAWNYVYRSGFDRWNADERSDLMSRARANAEKAIHLDPLLPEAQVALGAVYARDAQWEQAERSFRRGIELDPSSSLARDQFALDLLLPLGRIEEAVAQRRLAEKSDPLSPGIENRLASALFIASRFDEAAKHCEQPCIQALLLSGKAAEAIPILEDRFKDDLSKSGTGELGRAYALTGRRDDAERIARIQWRPIEQAEIFAALGDKESALKALERAIPLGPVRVGRDLTYPEFAPLRGDPRVKLLRRTLGLPE